MASLAKKNEYAVKRCRVCGELITYLLLRHRRTLLNRKNLHLRETGRGWRHAVKLPLLNLLLSFSEDVVTLQDYRTSQTPCVNNVQRRVPPSPPVVSYDARHSSR